MVFRLFDTLGYKEDVNKPMETKEKTPLLEDLYSKYANIKLSELPSENGKKEFRDLVGMIIKDKELISLANSTGKTNIYELYHNENLQISGKGLSTNEIRWRITLLGNEKRNDKNKSIYHSSCLDKYFPERIDAKKLRDSILEYIKESPSINTLGVHTLKNIRGF